VISGFGPKRGATWSMPSLIRITRAGRGNCGPSKRRVIHKGLSPFLTVRREKKVNTLKPFVQKRIQKMKKHDQNYLNSRKATDGNWELEWSHTPFDARKRENQKTTEGQLSASQRKKVWESGKRAEQETQTRHGERASFERKLLYPRRHSLKRTRKRFR